MVRERRCGDANNALPQQKLKEKTQIGREFHSSYKFAGKLGLCPQDL